MIQEILGKKVRLRSIDVVEYKIFFSTIPGDKGTLAIIASGGNYFLQKSLENFVQAIPADVQEEINTKGVELKKYRGFFDKTLLQTFPYLSIQLDSL